MTQSKPPFYTKSLLEKHFCLNGQRGDSIESELMHLIDELNDQL